MQQMHRQIQGTAPQDLALGKSTLVSSHLPCRSGGDRGMRGMKYRPRLSPGYLKWIRSARG
ncbi:hypothetical protein GFS31_05080 [Leptolyngbya sp. BL0902]|nr:hypothetical protein GFS31_05080 [Leptolyngbya sp. BL0902]